MFKALFVVCVFIAGMAAGMYSLPILVAFKSEPAQVAKDYQHEALLEGMFRSDLAGNDWLHWGEGRVTLSQDSLHFSNVNIAPGPDYSVYLTTEMVEDEQQFEAIKRKAQWVSKVKMFTGNHVFELPQDIELSHYKAVVIWCDAFGEFITAAELSAL